MRLFVFKISKDALKITYFTSLCLVILTHLEFSDEGASTLVSLSDEKFFETPNRLNIFL